MCVRVGVVGNEHNASHRDFLNGLGMPLRSVAHEENSYVRRYLRGPVANELRLSDASATAYHADKLRSGEEIVQGSCFGVSSKERLVVRERLDSACTVDFGPSGEDPSRSGSTGLLPQVQRLEDFSF